jgi:phosphatidylglycerophosphate synthase
VWRRSEYTEMRIGIDDLAAPYLAAPFGCAIEPNAFTIANMGVSLVLLLCIALLPSRPWVWGVIIPLTLVRWALDTIDGHVARRCNATSELGAMLDIGGDLGFLLGLLAVAIVFAHRRPGWWPGIAVAVGIALAATLSASEVVGTAMGRTKTFVERVLLANMLPFYLACIVALRLIRQ